MQVTPPNSAALRAQLETQVDFLTQLSRHSVDAFGQLGALNLQAARQLVDDGMELGRALAACRDPFQMISATMRVTQPAAEHWRSWQSGVMRVLAASGATLAHDANDGSWQAARQAADNTDPSGQPGAARRAG
ncbi:phasin family protein [Massilia sp. GCM10023247]|uniref:phasin family protein n=1 Tax=Massilia sp. GCM10023247 TaxID=3252643 RepID=UPI003618B948